MGCVNCSMPLDGAREKCRGTERAATVIGGLVDETARRSLRIKKCNYVKMKEGSISDYYDIGEKVGEGSLHSGAHGSVYRAVHRRLGQTRAIKMIARTRWSKQVQKQFASEVETLRRAVTPTQDHPNILKIYEVIKDAKYYHIVTELLTGGEMLDKILSGTICSEAMVVGYMQQILSAVSYCHEVSIIHRDLKPENLVFESKEEGAVLKVIDFGASCGITEELKDLAGTDYYLAPEILTKSSYNEKCDVWSCGVILYVLLCGYPPFNGSSVSKIHKRILEQPLGFPCNPYIRPRVAQYLTRSKEPDPPNARQGPQRPTQRPLPSPPPLVPFPLRLQSSRQGPGTPRSHQPQRLPSRHEAETSRPSPDLQPNHKAGNLPRNEADLHESGPGQRRPSESRGAAARLRTGEDGECGSGG